MSEEPIKKRTYKDAGVDIDAGARLVEAIKPLAKSTARPGADAELGGFGALFDIKAAGFDDPVLVAATDGVGTKLKIAIDTGRHGSIGIDLVAMCVNDLVVQGAEPLFFLDYFVTGALDLEAAEKVVGGIAEGCRMAGCALIGGESTEHPGLYGAGEYDLAGFAVGAVERGAVLPRADIGAGDIVLGLASSGLHANGFALVRQVIAEAGLAYDALAEARERGADLLIVDTAGRLHNRADLMAELQKIIRVLKKIDAEAPHSCLLVLDATVGQNAHSQVETFRDQAGVTGLIVTKLDGTARGGVVVALAERFALPVHAIGIGEGADDLRPFEARAFARSLLGLDPG